MGFYFQTPFPLLRNDDRLFPSLWPKLQKLMIQKVSNSGTTPTTVQKFKWLFGSSRLFMVERHVRLSLPIERIIVLKRESQALLVRKHWLSETLFLYFRVRMNLTPIRAYDTVCHIFTLVKSRYSMPSCENGLVARLILIKGSYGNSILLSVNHTGLRKRSRLSMSLLTTDTYGHQTSILVMRLKPRLRAPLQPLTVQLSQKDY